MVTVIFPIISHSLHLLYNTKFYKLPPQLPLSSGLKSTNFCTVIYITLLNVNKDGRQSQRIRNADDSQRQNYKKRTEWNCSVFTHLCRLKFQVSPLSTQNSLQVALDLRRF
ncbi:hypothetical protein L798_04057 [Zootermopsis nevadensis]|uniref:Uncharacterized protein n=1 Tax=Zootermopsis nevadensis TaxID=136037 RepID=A0A067RDR1_ZOONE|nr:hypothetical protein L798_04057 [Zootermopsis nevadensis]